MKFFMLRLTAATLTIITCMPVSHAASISNADQTPHTLMVTEAGQQNQIAVGAGESIEICDDGCFITFPNGDRTALSGSENIEIRDGAANIR